ncbi:MAG: phosphoribosylaminoimidazolesuccinocarboxamide synthase [Candidatus Micrarchaeota archaeon]|nr:phosphoribosylaminoimidazolesuccinocarboxamide synthase [Candidatus Micrarchaeota archaeon]
MDVITKTDLPLKPFSKGKVRDTYELENDLLMVATDRLSAFDVVFPQGIAYKGTVLTEISYFWFDLLKSEVKNHLLPLHLPPQLRGRPEALERRAMRVVKAKPLPVECVVRGYLVGSGWKDYQKSGAVCGHALPAGLQQASPLPQPLFTPSTKATVGHDENIDRAAGEKLVGKDVFDEIEEKTLRIYEKASAHAKKKGIILADTKLEFGIFEDEIILIDEVLTPDSSRYWPADSYMEGTSPPSFDKQFVRDYVESVGWNKSPPAPLLPADILLRTSSKYIDAYERITGQPFSR